MNRKQYEIDNLPTQIVIGHQTETGVTSIYFDCTSWLASWPDLVLGVWATQPGGTAAYPAATHMEGDVLVWDVTDSDTAVPGVGTVEIVGITTGKKKLSAIAKTQIMRTTTGTTTTPPEGAKAWVDNVMQAANDAETSKSQAATYAQNAAAAAEKAEENAKSVTWETLSGKPSTFPPDSHTHTLESLGAASAESVNQLKNDIGDAWASGTTYAVGDYCISGNRLYKCKTAHTAGSAFNANYWDAVSVGDTLRILDAKTSDVRLYTSADFASLNDAITIHSSTSAAVFGRVAVIFIRCTVNSSSGGIVLPFSTAISSTQYFPLLENPAVGWFSLALNKIFASTAVIYGKEYSGMITTIVN